MSDWSQYGYAVPPAVESIKLCRFCGEEITEGQPCVYRLVGKLVRGQKSGNLYVDEDPASDDRAAVLHLECEIPYLKFEDGITEEDELLKFCAGCGTKLSGDDD